MHSLEVGNWPAAYIFEEEEEEEYNDKYEYRGNTNLTKKQQYVSK
jgi:hypothetical protein